MLLDPRTWALAPRIDDVLLALDPELGPHVTAETHGSALELATGIHATASEVVAELGAGVVLDPMTATADEITEAVLRVLDDPAFAAAALRVREEILALPSSAEAVAWLERRVAQPEAE